jgi:hypothetical protein
MKHIWRRRRWLGWLAGIVVALAWRPPGAAASDMDIQNRVSVALENDDNVYLTHTGVRADELGRLFYDFDLNWRITPNNLWQTDYQLGAKVYFHQTSQDAIINQLQLGYMNFSIPTVQFGVQATGKLRLIDSALEDYLKFIGRGFVGDRFLDAFYVGVHAEYSQFYFRAYRDYDYWTQRYGADARYDHQRDFSAGVVYDFERKTFPYDAFRNIGGAANPVLVQGIRPRADDLNEVTAQFRYQTTFAETLPFLGTFSYTYQDYRSNSFGDSYDNHRFTLGLSQYIVHELSVHFLGVYQIIEAGQKTLIPQSFTIEEEDENYNQVEARINYGFTENLSVYAGYHRYWSAFPNPQFSFVKNVYGVGFAASF